MARLGVPDESESTYELRSCLSSDKPWPITKKPSRFKRFHSSWWTLEIISMAAGVAFFGLYLFLLKQYGGKSESEWKEHFLSIPFSTLQSAAAFVIALFRVCTFYPVTAAMGQLKWHYFGRARGRKIMDLEDFDAASRGVSGSFLVLFSKDSHHVFSVGCILIISTLYLGSSTQNTILQESRIQWYNMSSNATEASPAVDALLPFSRIYNRTVQNDNLGRPENLNADPRMQAAILTGWAWNENIREPSRRMNSLPITCSSGTCRWRNITTLDVGHACVTAKATAGQPSELDSPTGYSEQANITNMIEVTDANKPPSDRWAQIRLKPSLTVPSKSNFNESFGQSPSLILHLAGIAKRGDKDFEAVECVLYWQVWRIKNAKWDENSRSLNQTTIDQTSEAVVERPVSGNGGNITMLAPCNLSNDSQTCRYVVTLEAHRGLQNLLRNFLVGYVYEIKSLANSVFRSDDIVTDLFSWTWEKASLGAERPLLRSMDGYLTTMTTSISANIRSAAGTRKPGELGRQEQFFVINWKYVAYPGTILVVSLLLFGTTMFRTRWLPAWKNSPLPFLYHGFELPVSDTAGKLSNLAWMKSTSEHNRAILRKDADGYDLKLRMP